MEDAQRLSPANPLVVKLMPVLEAAEATQQAYSACRESREPVARLEACDRLLALVGNRVSAQAMAYDLRAHAKAELGDPVSTLSDLDMAMKLMPADLTFQEHRWRALFWVGRYNEALDGLEQLSKRDPSDMELRDAVATSRYALGDEEVAIGLFRAMITAAPQEDPPSLRAATIQSELDGGAAEAFVALNPTTEWLRTIVDYRTSHVNDDAFRQTIANQMPNHAAACLAEFHIGHKAALIKDSATARTALTDAIGICGFRGFEFHAAKKWLKALGG
jgi:tetratricopeptide (TPR) repeat protein